MTVNNQDSLTQITFHFVNGQSESFNVLQRESDAVNLQTLQMEIAQVLTKPWCILHLPEQTICIKTANVIKVDVKPCLSTLQGDAVFCNARRVTALNRTVQRTVQT